MSESIRPEELIDRARQLVPTLATAAEESERLRHPTDAVMAALEEAEIFKLMVPRCFGGFEMDMDTFLEVVLTLAEGDASLAWVTSFLIEHNWLFCLFPESFQKRLFEDRSYVLAPAMVAPTGQAESVDDGYVLSGRWQFATGIWHSSWIILGAIQTDANGAISPMFYAVPRDAVEMIETWDMDGMGGTGSHDVVAKELFVPRDQSVSMIDMNRGTSPGALVHPGPLYRTPMATLLTTAAALPAVGRARALVREFGDRLPTRRRMGMGPSQAEKPAAQMRFAEASISMLQSELLLRATVTELCEIRDAAGPAERVRFQAQIATAVNQSVDVAADLMAASGASAHQMTNTMGRARRDLEMIRTHVAFDLEAALENHGKAMLGLGFPPLA